MMAAIEKINREIKALRENIQRGIGGYEKEGKKQEVRINNLEVRIKELERWKRESMEKLRENEQMSKQIEEYYKQWMEEE